MAHSCIVNAQISISSDNQMFVKATMPIQKGEGVFSSYIDPLQTTLQRRSILCKGKHFVCRCRRCQDPSELGAYASGIRCPLCSFGTVLPYDIAADSHEHEQSVELFWKCSKCPHTMTNEEINRTEEVVQNIVKNIQRLPVDRHLIDRCEELFLTLPRKVHSNHCLLMKLRIHLVHLYGNVPGFSMTELSQSLLQRKANLCFELLDFLQKLCPGYSRLRSIILYEVHAPLVCIANKKFENGYINQNQLIQELQAAEKFLKEAVDILIHEPVQSPESSIAKAAMNDLKQLRDYVQDMERFKKSNPLVSL